MYSNTFCSTVWFQGYINKCHTVHMHMAGGISGNSGVCDFSLNSALGDSSNKHHSVYLRVVFIAAIVLYPEVIIWRWLLYRPRLLTGKYGYVRMAGQLNIHSWLHYITLIDTSHAFSKKYHFKNYRIAVTMFKVSGIWSKIIENYEHNYRSYSSWCLCTSIFFQ